jgi:uncharacterized protein YndB with AHSA1/START domain
MRKFIQAIAWIVLLLVVLFDIGLLLGMRLPREHTAVRTMRMGAPRQAVWQAITDFAKQPEWRSNLKSVERLPDRNGLQVWRENYKHMGSETLITEQFIPPTYLVRTIADDRGPVSGSWEFSLLTNPVGGGTAITLTERGQVRNPFVRFVANDILRYRYMDEYLRQLAAKFGEKPTISRR